MVRAAVSARSEIQTSSADPTHQPSSLSLYHPKRRTLARILDDHNDVWTGADDDRGSHDPAAKYNFSRTASMRSLTRQEHAETISRLSLCFPF
jgi:hypothetical protein